MSQYTFGDSALARDRLALVADTFEAPTLELLADLPVGFRRYVLDLGCGPGYTTTLLARHFPLAQVTGYDASVAMIEDARTRVPGASFCVADVAKPLLLPADVVYARLLLGHLPEPQLALDTWATALRPGNGIIVCEEPVRYRSDDPWFARYEDAVTAVVAATGATLWAGTVLDTTPRGCAAVFDRVVEHPVPVGRAAAMFWRNAAQWGGDTTEGAALVEHFRNLEHEAPDEWVMWEIRQSVWVRTLD